MTQHIFLPNISLEQGFINPAYIQYLKEWRENAIKNADKGDVAASICHQGALIDLVLYGKLRHDWLGIMNEFLMENEVPLAYSKAFGDRLFGFRNQSHQSTIHAIHTKWWIEGIQNAEKVDHDHFASIILGKRQTDGLIYDRDVSETILRHRMKIELTMSMAMSAEILSAAEKLSDVLSIELATDISDPKKCPSIGYMSMEYFRLKALHILGYENFFPVDIDKHIEACTQDLQVGWCDFAIDSKIDAYMGTAKRTQRDKPIHSPLISCFVSSLFGKVSDNSKKAQFIQRLNAYSCHLKSNPLDIPAFQMRDIPIHFGVDITPIETICASFLITQCQIN